MNERLDALLSAERDGALEPGEAAELARLRGESDAAGVQARARAEAFAAVDAQLRVLASAPVDDARLARNLEALRRRLAPSEARPASDRRFSRRRFAAGVAAALAAGLVWASVTALRQGVSQAPAVEPVESVAAVESIERVEAGEPIERVAPEDLEVIEELELLEYLVARESSGGGA